MGKEKLKKPYQSAETEIVYIHSSDVIQTSGGSAGEPWDGTNVPGSGWT